MQELANELNVSAVDLGSLVHSVINSLHEDGMVEKFYSATEEQRIEICEAYVIAAVKKMNSFASTYMTNPEARRQFIKTVFAL